jgi:hypothetical protein
MRAVLAAIALCLLSASALAQQDFPKDVTVGWTNPDSYVDDTLIEAGDLDAIRIEIYRQNDTVPVFTATVPDTGEGLDQEEVFAAAIPQPGTYRIEGYAIVVGGVESDPSVPLFKKYTGKPRRVILKKFE